jgi:alpha-glucosidase (family GH31 glycosyl hydrolase)
MDPIHYKDLPTFVSELHAKNMHYIPILDATTAQRESGEFLAYQNGKEMGAFLKTESGELLTEKNWPNDVVIPDWFNPKAIEWW